MSASRTTDSNYMLAFPYEIRQIIYRHVFDKEYIFIPYPQDCRYEEHQRRPYQTVFYHPDPGNLHVYGINNASCAWVVQHVPLSDFMPMRFDYDPPNRNMPRSYSSPDQFYPFPLGATCSQIHSEVLDLIRAERATFAFSDFRSLIIWLKRTDPAVLARVRKIKFEAHLKVSDENESSTCGISEDDEPWFDALKIARERLTGLRSFSMHAELCGPPLLPTETFGPFRRIPRVSDELNQAFASAAERVIEEMKMLVPDENIPVGKETAAEAKEETDEAEEPTLISRSRRLHARHLRITAVQRYTRVGGSWTWSSKPDWRCMGREHSLSDDIVEKMAALEIMPPWQVAILMGKLNEIRAKRGSQGAATEYADADV